MWIGVRQEWAGFLVLARVDGRLDGGEILEAMRILPKSSQAGLDLDQEMGEREREREESWWRR